MSQGSTVLPTTGVFSGLTEQGSINGALAALLSNNSGGAAPSAPAQYQFWADTSVSGQITLRMYIGTTWVPMMVADTSTGAIIDDPLSPKNWAIASGLSDTIVATYDPPLTTRIDGMTVAFRASAANLSTTPTFNPNGLGATQITKNGGQLMAIGDIAGSRAEVLLRWNAADNTWEMLNPPAVPVGGIVPYFGGTLPSGYALPQGQNLSATTFPAANAVLGTTYGNPGGGNFTMPDLRGRCMVALDAGGSGRITSAGGNWDGTVLGNTGGIQNRTIAQNQLPNVSPSLFGISATITTNQGAVPSYDANHTLTAVNGGSTFGNIVFAIGQNPSIGALTANYTPAGSVAINGGVSQESLSMMPPSMSINVMMRIA